MVVRHRGLGTYALAEGPWHQRRLLLDDGRASRLDQNVTGASQLLTRRASNVDSSHNYCHIVAKTARSAGECELLEALDDHRWSSLVVFREHST
jgi:hypothetical protein